MCIYMHNSIYNRDSLSLVWHKVKSIGYWVRIKLITDSFYTNWGTFFSQDSHLLILGQKYGVHSENQTH